MQIFRHYNALPEETRGSAVAVGNFDGVHRGHQAVIAEAGHAAAAMGVPWAVLTFEPHPRSVFTPREDPFRLTPFRSKARYIQELGVDTLVVLHFDGEFSQRSAESFVHDVLVGGLGARHVVSGYDFVFGHDRRGTCELLLHMGKEEGFDFTAVSAVEDENGEVFSSTRVREFLRTGDPGSAAGILGRPFEIEGQVREGDKRGRTIGCPTANLALDDYLRPALGVYAVRVGLEDGKGAEWHGGVANLGRRPTFGGEEILLEAHLFDFDGDLYDQHLRVALVDYLRPEKKFDGLEALKAQIEIDGRQAREVLASQR
jgi:riboflavin kinase/FMN adenylyltransferase